MYNPKPHEKTFKLHPVGVKYICEFCNEGEQIAVSNEPIVVPMSNGDHPIMRKHRCNKCGKEMMLPKSYPYIEWDTDESEEGENNDQSAEVHMDEQVDTENT